MVPFSRQWFLLCFVFDALRSATSFSDSWATTNPSLNHPTVVLRRNSELRCQRQRLNGDRSGLPASNPLSRRGLLGLLSVVATSRACSSAASEVDPFAAMDDMISSGAASGFSSSLGTPAAQTTTGRETKDGTAVDAAPSGTPPGTPNSDMAAALQESAKKRRIDPRTHG